MIIIATLVVALAAAVHVGVFFMQSINWTRQRVWRRFGVASQEGAELTKGLAYSQGFYNLFLAIGAVVGVILFGAGMHDVGMALVIFTLSCMVLAAIVLLTTGRHYLMAMIQGMLPVAGLVLIFLA